MISRLQAIYLLLGVVNGLLKFIPFFSLRRYILIAAGAKIHKTAAIHRNVKIMAFGRLEIGENSVINNRCLLDNRGNISIGNNVSIAHCTKIYTMGHDIDSPNFAAKGNAVKIEDHVVIFSNVLVMPGIYIKNGAVIFAGSVVTKNIDELTVVGGNPARKIKVRNKSALAYKLDYSVWLGN